MWALICTCLEACGGVGGSGHLGLTAAGECSPMTLRTTHVLNFASSALVASTNLFLFFMLQTLPAKPFFLP